MVNFENGTLVTGAYVEINGIQYPVIMPVYSGNTPLTAENLNKAQNDLYDRIKREINTGMEEVPLNEYIDGSQVYKLRVMIGSLPNTTYKDVSTGLTTSTINLLKIEGTAKSSMTNVILPLPFVSPIATSCIGVNMQANGDIRVTTGTNRTDLDLCFIDLYYTKNAI